MRKHVAGPAERRRPATVPGSGRACGVAGLTLEKLVTLWRLRRGGLAVAECLPLINVKIHGTAARTAAETFETLLTSPLPLHGSVRCGGCGGLIVEVPCLRCGSKTEAYKIPEKRQA